MTPRDGYTCEWVECLHANIPPTRKCNRRGVSFNPLGLGLADARASLCFRVETHPTLISDLPHASKSHAISLQRRERSDQVVLERARLALLVQAGRAALIRRAASRAAGETSQRRAAQTPSTHCP